MKNPKSFQALRELGVSKNRGTTKWMVFNGKPENPIKTDDLGVSLFLETPNSYCFERYPQILGYFDAPRQAVQFFVCNNCSLLSAKSVRR